MRGTRLTFGALLLVVACAPSGSEPLPAATTSPVTSSAASEDVLPAPGSGCADVVGAEITPTGDTYTVVATVRSADTGWDKYADRWEVRTLDGEVLGVRELAHPHETEQPFTRSLTGVMIPEGADEVQLWARDSVEGFCGRPFTVPVPGRP